MARVQNSGYIVTPITVAFSGAAVLNSLGDEYWTSLSDEIDNSSNKYAWADFELIVGSAAYTGADSRVELYLVPSIDGTNYPTWTGNSSADKPENLNFPRWIGYTTATTAAQRIAFVGVGPLPQGKFKVGIRNRANAAFPSSGNSLTYRPYSQETT